MSLHRIDRLQEEIQHEVSSILLFEVTDPWVKGVTITHVMVTKDLGLARVYYEVPSLTSGEEKASPASEKKIKDSLQKIQKGLNRAKGFFRKQLASRLSLRVIPEIEFFYDEQKDALARVDALFAKIGT